MCSASDSTRGVIFGGFASPATLNVIQYITIASLGNGVDFGDLDHAGCKTAGFFINKWNLHLAEGRQTFFYYNQYSWKCC